MHFIFISLLIIISVNVHALSHFERLQIEKRIKPLGQVRLEKSDKPVANSKPEQGGPKANSVKEIPSQAIYKQHCSICHRDGLANAPKFRVIADWGPRLAKKTLAELIASAIIGVNAMPAKGTCFNCSEVDLKNAIQYMLPQP